MNHAVALSAALVFASAALSAQTASQSQPQIEIHKTVTSTAADGSIKWTTTPASEADVQKAQRFLAPLLNTCPVSLSAQQSSSAFKREVGSGSSGPEGVAQWLHLNIANPDSRRVVAATVTVHGFADKSRMVPAASAVLSNGDSSDAARTLDVRFSAVGGGDVGAQIRVPGLTGVTSIELKAVTYGDGSTWKLAAGGSCSVPIGGLMLVGNQ